MINVLITNISKVNTASNFNDDMLNRYQDDYAHGERIGGFMTNTPPIKSLMLRLNDQNQKLDYVLSITSDMVRKAVNRQKGWETLLLEKETHYEYFLREIREWCEKHEVPLPNFSHEIGISDEPNELEIAKALTQINSILLRLAETEIVNIYIESNGGIRYSLPLLLTMTSSLEKIHPDKVHIKEVLSMVHGENSSKTRICDRKGIYDTTQISSFVDEFMYYGRSEALKKYFTNRMEELEEEKKNSLRNCIEKLTQTANDIQLCRSDYLLEAFYGENNLQNTLQAFIDENKNNETDAVIVEFLYVAEIIKAELPKDMRTQSCEDKIINLPEVIKWCLERSFIQQALTLCSERLPKYLFEKKILQINEEMGQLLENRSDKKYEKYYYFLVHFNNYDSQLWEQVVAHLNDSNAIPDKMAELIRIKNAKNKFVKSLSNRKNWNEQIAAQKLEQNGFTNQEADYILHHIKVKVSNNYDSETFLNVLNGKVCKDGKLEGNKNLETISDIQTCLEKCKFEVNLYKRILRTDPLEVLIQFFGNEEAAKPFYTEYESKLKRIYIQTILDSGIKEFKSDVNTQEVQKLLYLYVIAKEQRNFSNHANVDESKKALAFDVGEIRRLLETIIQTILAL